VRNCQRDGSTAYTAVEEIRIRWIWTLWKFFSGSVFFILRVDCGGKPETDIVQNADGGICPALEDAALVCLFHCINMWRYSFCGMWNVL
jgi:hypothetical protein